MILVTGGAGFIGSHIVDALLDRGHDVRVLDLAPARNDGAEQVTGDVRDPDAVRRAIAGVRTVCHQAAMVGLGVDFADVADYTSHNDLGTAIILRELGAAGFGGNLVLASSMVVYGEGRYRCATHGIVRPGPRAPADLDAGGYEPPCPRVRRPAHRRAGPRRRARRPAQRLRRDQAPSGAPRAGVRWRYRCHGDRAALPQRLRASDAARDSLRRRRVDLRIGPRRRPRAAGARGRRPAARLRPRPRRRRRQRPRHRGRHVRHLQRLLRHAAQRARHGERAPRRGRRPRAGAGCRRRVPPRRRPARVRGCIPRPRRPRLQRARGLRGRDARAVCGAGAGA